MKYVLKITFTCPDGTATKQQLSIAKDEAEMKTMLDLANRPKSAYADVTCLGPVEEIPGWMLKD
jgi:hypothetical protein